MAETPASSFAFEDEDETFNFQTANVLLVEQSGQGLDILVQVFNGFGTRNCYKARSVEQAKQITQQFTLDLVVIDPALDETSGVDYVRWLRRCGIDPNRSAPVIVVSANGTRTAVGRARDAGASYFLVKPVRPNILFDRVIRVGREQRAFVMADTYVGPDRRFKSEGPPPGIAPRRSTDVLGATNAARAPNLSQDEIDDMLSPQKIQP